jgi:type II secretory pathway component PulJ
MTPDVNGIASVLGTIATGGLAAWAARSAKRTKSQERRDDFTTVTNRMDKEIKRLEVRQVEQQDQITGQGAAIAWLVTDRGRLVGYIRKAGGEPPAPRPIPPKARPYLDNIDV